MDYQQKFDCIVVGGGHAGTEAALACARMGAKTLLITHNIETLGMMSCNPAIGGIGKGHLVKEIDAMGGVMAKAADHAGIQFRVLNSRKGPAVRATRAQTCRALYRQFIRKALETQPNLSLFQQPVHDLILQEGRCVGVKTQMGLCFYSTTVVLTVGTFLAGKIHIGQENYEGGRAGDAASMGLAGFFREHGLRVGRLKTGTPPRIDGKSIDFSKLEEQPGDNPRPVFSFVGSQEEHPKQLSCFITHTNEKTHDIIRGNLNRSAMYSGNIEGVGPRYCPSIEDKVVRFADKTSHQIFVEPEGLFTHEFYPNGISTSLPFDVQIDFVRSMRGFENAHITRPGYAIEYDYFDPRDLKSTLETKAIEALFFAGQINGTTGYEEAAAQGLIAGVNAALMAQGKSQWSPARSEAYMGVLIDDLITHGTLEPYRMFTSRAEYRLLLREDNADLRLTPKARSLGLVGDDRWRLFESKLKHMHLLNEKLKNTWISPGSDIGKRLKQELAVALTKETTLEGLLKRPELDIEKLASCLPEMMTVDWQEQDLRFADSLTEQIKMQVETQAKYAGYIEKQHQEIAKAARLEHTAIPSDFDYDRVSGLSAEVCEKLKRQKPETVAHASRISGVTPAAVSLLLVYIKRKPAAEVICE